MKILFIHTMPLDLMHSDGDLQNSVLSVASLCQAFSDMGQDITLALPIVSHSHNDFFDWFQNNLLKNPGFGILSLEKTNYRKNKLYKYIPSRELIKTIKNVNPDVIITRNVQLGIYTTAIGFKTIIDIHSPKLAKFYIIDSITRYYLKKYSEEGKLKIITLSKSLSEYYVKRGINPKNITVAHNGFEPESFKNNTKKDIFRKKFAISQQNKIVLYAGSFWPGRGVELFLDVAELMPDTAFIMIGGPGRFKARLADEMERKKLKNTKIISSVNRNSLPEYLFSADVLVGIFSSNLPTAEYFSSLKLIEYMATGKPVVTQDYLSVQELIVDGESGYIAKKGCAKSLAQKITGALSDPFADQIGKKAREFAFHQLTWAHRAEKVLSSLNF